MKQSNTLFNEPFQAVDCTGTDHQKQGNKTLQDYISETQTNTKMWFLTKQTKPWFCYYYLLFIFIVIIFLLLFFFFFYYYYYYYYYY